VTQVQRKRNLAELERVVQDLRILNAQLRQQVWLDQKLLATELHGSVQATLHATALSLANNKKASVADLDKVMQSVQSVVDRLGEAAYLEGESFDQVLEDIAVVWEDVCQVNYEITAEASALLEGDPKAARSAIEVVRETITNAIKHNSAKHVNVELSVNSSLLKLKISNPGELSLAKEAGLGSEIMAELTYQHNLEQVGDQVVLIALIPQSLAVEQ
jgi:signal transduction histidine kinase